MKSPAHVLRTAWRYAPWAAREVSRRGRPRHLVHFYGDTPGDDLMCTVIVHELRKRGHAGIWMMSRFPELFRHNPDVDEVVPFDFRYQRLAAWLRAELLYAHYGGHDHATDRSPVPERHIIALMCEACGITGPVTLRPRLFLTAEERSFGRLSDRQITLHSSGLTAASAMKNKEWIDGRLQQVVTTLQREFTFVQLGSARDPLLEGCVDRRGKTTMRESAAVIANSRLFLGQVGFLMHLARSVDVPSVIVYGGREQPWQSGYTCNTNLYAPLPCSPCWRWNACDNEFERACMHSISVESVVAAVRARAAMAPQRLVEDTAVLTHEHVIRARAG